jgi:hypothetical protein
MMFIIVLFCFASGQGQQVQSIESAPLTLSSLLAVGGALLGILGLIFGIMVRDRQVMRIMSEIEVRLSDKIVSGDDKVHTRINALDGKYVKAEEIEAHVNTIKGIVNGMRSEFSNQMQFVGKTVEAAIVQMTATNKRIDEILLKEAAKKR